MSLSFPFKSSKNLKAGDIDASIKKLKALYQKYSSKYGAHTFNLRAFEKRYLDALHHKVDLRVFLHAEITVFEELKKKVVKDAFSQSVISHKSLSPSYGEIADRIIEKNLEKIRGYRYIDFHPDAEEETKYLLGAVTDFYYEVWPKLVKIVRSMGIQELNTTTHKLENDFTYYVVPMRGVYSRAIEDFNLVLSRKNSRENERAAVNFIRYGGILLNNCRQLIHNTMMFLENKQKVDSEKSALEELLTQCNNLIDDFRLGDIRSY